jgi:hypothetical protein
MSKVTFSDTREKAIEEIQSVLNKYAFNLTNVEGLPCQIYLRPSEGVMWQENPLHSAHDKIRILEEKVTYLLKQNESRD